MTQRSTTGVGASAAVIGATIGATLIFLVARTAFGEPLLRRAGPRANQLAKGFRDDAFSYRGVLACRTRSAAKFSTRCWRPTLFDASWTPPPRRKKQREPKKQDGGGDGHPIRDGRDGHLVNTPSNSSRRSVE